VAAAYVPFSFSELLIIFHHIKLAAYNGFNVVLPPQPGGRRTCLLAFVGSELLSAAAFIQLGYIPAAPSVMKVGVYIMNYEKIEHLFS